MHVCMYMYVYVCICMYMYVYVCICMYMYVYVCICMYMYVCVYVCMYVCMYVCVNGHLHYVRTQTQFDGFVSFVGSQFGELRGWSHWGALQ